jgi:hypothetical protein
MYGPLLPLYLKSLNASVVQIGLFFTLSQIIPWPCKSWAGGSRLAGPLAQHRQAASPGCSRTSG